MPISSEALDIENRGYLPNGEAVLIDAYKLLRNEWKSGVRDRELGLHLFFLSWYGLVEPLFVFGEFEEEKDRLQETFIDVFEYFEPDIEDDPELLYVIGLAAHLFPFALGDEAVWAKRGDAYRQRYHKLKPEGIDPELFIGRGAFGSYYFHQATNRNGY